MKRILIANIFGIGDVLFTTPLITNLKKKFGGVSVDYLCNVRTKGVVEHIPDADNIVVYEKDDIVKLWHTSKIKCLKMLHGLFRVVRRKKYDAVFDFTLSRKLGLFFKLAGIPRRIGPDYRNRGMFLTDKKILVGFEKRHVVEYYLDLLDCLKVPVTDKNMKLVPSEKEVKTVLGLLDEKIMKPGYLVAVIPGGGASWGENASRKRWGSDGFSRVADILSETGVNIAVIGDSYEMGLCRSVASKMMNRPAICKNDMTLKRYIAFLSKCDLVLCNDGGPLHMAAALNVKTVSIFGPVDDKVYGPYPSSASHKVIVSKKISCRPCYNRFKLPECGKGNQCLTDITPKEVAKACLELLDKR